MGVLLILVRCLAFSRAIAGSTALEISARALHPGDDYYEEDDGLYYQEDVDAGRQQMPPVWARSGDCDFAVDMSCPYQKYRTAFYHRIVDCLLPGYGLLEVARAAKGTVCILTCEGQPSNIDSFLSILTSNSKSLRILCSKQVSNRSLPRHVVDPSPLKGVSKKYLNEFGSLSNVVGRHPIDFLANARALHRDIARVATPPGKLQLIYTPRRKSRSFAAATQTALQDMLRGVASADAPKGHVHLEYIKYAGGESIVRTFEMFMNAAGLVGFHGAAFGNAVFTARPSCVMEITTYKDLNNSIPWRTNEFLVTENSFLIWHTIYIKLSTLTGGTLSEAPLSGDMDHWVKGLQSMELLGSDVENLKQQLTKCLHEHVFKIS